MMGSTQIETVYCDFTAFPGDPSTVCFGIIIGSKHIILKVIQINADADCCNLQVSRRGSDKLTSNLRPSTSMFREIQTSAQEGRFLFKWKD